MKKFYSFFIVVGLLMSAAMPASAAETTISTSVISTAEANIPQTSSSLMTEAELRAIYWASDEFQTHYSADPADALELLEKVVDDYFASCISAFSTTDDEVASVSAPLIQQWNGYTCGPASSYMAICGWDGAGSISGSTTADKFYTLETQMGSVDSTGTLVSMVRSILNTYTSERDYTYYEGSTLSEFLFRIYTFNSLSYERAPILHAKTASLSYYNGHNTGHYIAVTEFDYNTMEVRLQDPHSNDLYYGIHQVPYEEAYGSIANEPGRFYICYWN